MANLTVRLAIASFFQQSFMQQLMATTKTMQAAWYEKQGAANVIQYGEMPVPNPGAGEVRGQVHASGVNLPIPISAVGVES